VHFLSARDKNLVSLGVWPMDNYSPNLVIFGPGVLQYHATTVISPSLMHLFFSFTFLFCCCAVSHQPS